MREQCGDGGGGWIDVVAAVAGGPISLLSSPHIGHLYFHRDRTVIIGIVVALGATQSILTGSTPVPAAP